MRRHVDGRGLRWRYLVAQTASMDLRAGRPVTAPVMFGRDRELAVVGSLLAGVADGGGSLLVLGDPGIGKSALAEDGVSKCDCPVSGQVPS